MSDQIKLLDSFINESVEMYRDEIKKQYSREKSWELCYNEFHSARQRNHRIEEPEIIRKYTLELVSYLASFGMFRNSILMEMHYLALNSLISILFDNKYSCIDDDPKDSINKILQLKKEITSELKNICKNTKCKKNITNTLVSKIMLGTYGCVVAYDTEVTKNLKIIVSRKYSRLTSFSEESIKWLYEVYQNYNIHNRFKKVGIENGLTPMREMDIVLWYWKKTSN